VSPFEFFFSFYGLILGLSIAALAGGVATAVQHRRRLVIGRMTPLLAAFVALDIASFWETAWSAFRDLPFSYGLLVAGMVIATIYFVAASLVFPHTVEDGTSLTEHFWTNKRWVLLLTTLANMLLVAALVALRGKVAGDPVTLNYLVTGTLYLLLIVPAALSRRPWLVATLLGLHTAIYLVLAVLSVMMVQPGGTAPTSTPPRNAER
jgi:hypothetical protein